MRAIVASACLTAGCLGSGSLELDLSLPTVMDLRPQGYTTVTVLATSADGQTANTSLVSGSSANDGDLPAGNGVQIDVLLRDVSNRLVGVGEAADLIDIKAGESTKLTIPVRRPFVYTSSKTTVYTFDPTLDPRDQKFQGQLSGLASPQVAVSVGGDRLVVGGGMQLQIVDTATHKVTGQPINVPGMISDVAPVPGAHRVAVAHAGGIAIVDLDAMNVLNAPVGAIDRVTVGPDANGKMFAYGLIGRTAPAETPLFACMGSSSLVAVSIDSPTMTTPKPLPQPVSAIAAAPSGSPQLFAALPCAGQVAKLMGDPTAEVAQLSLSKLADLPGAAVVAVLGERVWSAATRPSSPVSATSGGTPTMCTTTTQVACPEPNATHLEYVTQGARLVVQSIPLAGGMPITLELPERRETMIATDDPAQQHAQVLHSLGIVPLDLVVQPGGQYVSVVARSSYYIASLKDTTGLILLPCLQATTGDWMLLDMASSSVAQRVRTACMLTVGPNAYFPMWGCDSPPEAETTKVGEYMPQSVGALFGAR